VRIFDATKDLICGVKVNFHLIITLSLEDLAQLNRVIAHANIPAIADIKLNDIDNTNRVATEYLWSSGFSAVIVNPFAGYEGALDVVFKRAFELGKGVITLAYMSHKGAEEGFGLVLRDGRTVFDLFLDRAVKWKADGIIMGTTRTERIAYAKKRIPSSIRIFSPGSGAQGGSPTDSFEAGSDYLIYGRSLIASPDPRRAAQEICKTMLPLIEKRRRREERF
jgi:orotidine-5'-phosphate decarboxylase